MIRYNLGRGICDQFEERNIVGVKLYGNQTQFNRNECEPYV